MSIIIQNNINVKHYVAGVFFPGGMKVALTSPVNDPGPSGPQGESASAIFISDDFSIADGDPTGDVRITSWGVYPKKANDTPLYELCNVDSYSPEDSVLNLINRHISASDPCRASLLDSYYEFLDRNKSLPDSEREFYLGIFKAYIEAKAVKKAISILSCGSRVGMMECEHCGYSHNIRYNCKLRICPRCSAIRAAELVAKYQPYLESLDPSRVRCITLTMKNVKCLISGVSKIRRAFVKLLHRKYYKKLVDGGLYHIEVTLDSEGLWHIHIHAIIVGGYIPQDRLSKDWEDVTKEKVKAKKSKDVVGEQNSLGDDLDVEGSPVVWIERKEVRATLKYCMKHLLKKMKLNDNWTPEKLVEYEMALSDVRLVQPFGCFLDVPKKSKEFFKCPRCGWVLWKITDITGKVVKSSLDRLLRDYRKNKSP